MMKIKLAKIATFKGMRMIRPISDETAERETGQEKSKLKYIEENDPRFYDLSMDDQNENR